MKAVGELLVQASRWLEGRGVSSPRLDAELLLGHLLGLSRLQVYLQHDRPMEQSEVDAFRELLRRRGARIPMGHILGRREFYGRDFSVAPGLLVPRPDTETLVDVVLRLVPPERSEPFYVADVGSGTGCVGLTIAVERPSVRLYAIDTSREALACTRENAIALGVKDRVALLEGDLLQPLPMERTLDLVVSNPPYISTSDIDGLEPEVRDHEDRRALDGGPDGLAVVRRLVPQAAERARLGLAMEVGHRQAPDVEKILRGLFAGVTGHRDLAGHLRVLLALHHMPAGDVAP